MAPKALPSSELVLVTPDMAEAWLAHASPNRTISDPLVDAYSRDMAARNWRVNGASISFNRLGQLIDGQHRLWACVQAQTPFQTFITKDLHEEAMATIDTGRHRSFGDHLSISSRDSLNGSAPKDVAALARVIWCEEKHGVPIAGFGSHYRPTHSELTDTLTRHPTLVSALSVVEEVSQKNPPLASRPLIAYVFYRALALDDALATHWLHAFLTGENLPSGHPCAAARNRIITLKTGHASGVNRRGRHTVNRRLSLAILIKSWNFLHEGRTGVSVIRYSDDETFPTIT